MINWFKTKAEKKTAATEVSYTIGLISSVWMITFMSNKTQANFLANVCFSLFPIPQLFTIWDFDIIYAN